MNPKQIIFFLLFLFILSSSVYAVAPITSTTTFVGDIGIQIEMNNMEYYKVGEERWNIIYAFNLSNGMILNSTNSNVVCINHLRNSQGFEVGQQTATRSGKYFYLNGSSGKNNPAGIYTYTINCQDINAGLGGYKSGFFEVTEFGKEKGIYETQWFFYFVIIIGAILIIIGFNVEDFALVSVGGMCWGLLGGNILIHGFSSFSNEVSLGLGIILAVVGAYFFLRPIVERVMSDLNDMG